MNKKKDIKIFLIIFAITCIIFIPFLTGHLATDTYNIINRGYKEYAIRYSLNDGRPVMCLISLLASKINLPIQVYVILLTFIALIVSCISIVKFKNIIMNYTQITDKKREYIILAISYVVIFNFAYLENLQYAECAVMSVTILLYIVVAQMIVEKNRYYIIKSIILTIISMLFYQGTMNWLVTLVFIFSIIKEKKINKQVIKNVFLSGIFILIACGVDLIQIRITGKILGFYQMRMGSIKKLSRNLGYIADFIPYVLINTYDIFPKYLLLIYISIIMTYMIVFIKDDRCSINVLAIILISICTCFAPNLSTLASIGSPRMQFSIGAMMAVLLMYIYYENQSKKEAEKTLMTIMISYILVILVCYTSIMYQHKIVNFQEKNESKQIGEWIKEYENDSGIEIKNVAFIFNGNSKNFFKNIRNKSSICSKGIYSEWSRIGVINYYNQRTFKEIREKSENNYKYNEYKEYFKDCHWDELNKEQLQFDGDTLYLYVY